MGKTIRKHRKGLLLYCDLATTQHIIHAAFNCAPTAPVSMSYINAPKLHQSTARLWPLLIKISGALQ